MADPISDYVQAYKSYHGRLPVIEKRGSWLAIGGGVFATKCRKSQLPSMTANLRYLAKQKETGE